MSGVAERDKIVLSPDKPTKNTYLLGKISANKRRYKYKAPRRIVSNAHPLQRVPSSHPIKSLFKQGIHMPLEKTDTVKPLHVELGNTTAFLLNCLCLRRNVKKPRPEDGVSRDEMNKKHINTIAMELALELHQVPAQEEVWVRVPR
jgi:hypothetical protein